MHPPSTFRLLAGAIVALCAPVLGAQDDLAPHHLITVDGHDPHALTVAIEQGIALDCQGHDDQGRLYLLATDADLDEFRRRGVSHDVTQANLEEFYARRALEDDYIAPATNPPFGGGGMGGYFTYSEVLSILDDFATQHPSICSPRTSIGGTVEGRDLWMIKISDNWAVDEDEPESRMDSLHHAREPMSMTTLLYYMEWLLSSYGTDPLATHLVNERELYFVPVVNPDGYEYNRQTNPNGGGLWRKNRRNNGGSSRGVDLNRNYSFQWGYDNNGSSGDRDSNTYRGPSPASEPETQAMQAFIDARNFRTSNSAHSYSNLWLYAWGYICNDPPGKSDLDLIGDWFTRSNGYVYGSICQTLYSANGNTVDYDFGVHGTYAGTIEVGSGSDGFWPSPSRIIPLCEENLRAYQRLSLYAGAGLEYPELTWTEVVGDGDGFFEQGEEFELVADVLNVGTAATVGSALLQASTADATIELLDDFHDFGSIPAFTGRDNGNDPLRFRVGGGADGETATVTVTLEYDGYVDSVDTLIVFGEPRSGGRDDLETNYGWITGVAGDNADRGEWELADPSQTSSGGDVIQPGNDHSSNGSICAVTDGRSGSGAGSYDVDDGLTTLISPQFDLEDAISPALSYWRWYTCLGSTPNDDDFVVDISNDDGSTWTEVERFRDTRNQWNEVVFFPGELLGLTDRMRLRFRAEDDPNNSLTEALVDDVTVLSYVGDDTLLWRYGTARRDEPIQLGLRGEAGSRFLMYAALDGGSADLGSLGIWELDFSSQVKVLVGTLDGNGDWDLATNLPDDPALIGQDIHLQTTVFASQRGTHFSNAVDFVVE